MEFRILGPLDVLDDGHPIRLGAAKERAVLAVLLLHAGNVVARERLIDELWGECPPMTAAKAVNVHISQLRKALAVNGTDPIATRAGGYAIDVAPDALDATRFEDLVDDARACVAAGDVEAAAKTFREALALWRGPALAGVVLESVARSDVDRLEELRLSALLDRIDCDLALGRHDQVIAELERLLVEYPLRERLLAQLMLALYRAGRQADALATYREARNTFADELGLEPSVALQRLERGILNHEAALAAPAGIAHIELPKPTPTPRPAAAMRRRPRRLLGAAALAVTIVGAGIGVWARKPGGGHGQTSPTIAITANSVVRLDGASGKPLSDIPVGDTPVSIAATPAAMWVVNRRDRTVSRIDRVTGRVRTIGGVAFPYDVAADSHGNVWISDARASLVARITSGTQDFPASPAPPETIAVPGRAGALAVGGGFVWVANAVYSTTGRLVGRTTVSRIDLRSHRFAASIDVAELPHAIAFGYGSTWVLTGMHSLAVIRSGSREVESFALPLDADDFTLSVAVGAGGVWVVTLGGNILRIDPETRRVVSKVPAPAAPLEPLGAAVGAGFLWLATRGDQSVAMLDPRTDKIVRSLPLGRIGVVPCGIATTPTAIWVTIGPDTDCGSSATR